VDFIDVMFVDFIYERWPTFNLADSWVTIGISLLFISSFESKKGVKLKQECVICRGNAFKRRIKIRKFSRKMAKVPQK